MRSIVDKALDKYVQQMATKGIDPEGVYAKTLAAFAGVSTPEMSTALQEYRLGQKRVGATKYVVGCEGYGRAARWRIQSKPSSDPKAVRKSRKEHATYLAKDGLTRLIRDYAHETYPALKSTQLDKVISITINGLERQVSAAVDTAVALIEAEAI